MHSKYTSVNLPISGGASGQGGPLEHILYIGAWALAFLFAFVNGFHDGGDLIAASVLSRSLTARAALCLTGVAAFIGPLLFGTAVATTIGKEIVDTSCLLPAGGMAPTLFLVSALVSALAWSLLTWWVGIAPGSFHALIGGLVGGALAAFGLEGIHWSPLFFKVLLILFISPVLGMLLGLAFSRVLTRGGEGRRKPGPKKIQVASLFLLAASHGTNNAQKAMALIAMMLLASGSIAVFGVPSWAMLGCAVALAAGVLVGGWRVAKIRGNRVFRIEPVHSLTSQVATSAVVLAATFLGGPVSTGEIVKATILGVGAGDRLKRMHRLVAKDIAMAWLVSAPASAFLAAVIYWCLSGALGEGMGRFGEVMKVFGQ
jgi:PiT family inorganic phosphate transporter